MWLPGKLDITLFSWLMAYVLMHLMESISAMLPQEPQPLQQKLLSLKQAGQKTKF
jgi:hypothetical protein